MPFLFGLRPFGAKGRRRNWGGAARSGAGAAGAARAMTHQANGAGADPASGRLPQLLSALFYGTCSFLIVLVNKALLTTYG